MKKKISVGVVIALIFTLAFGSIPVLADTYVAESTPCNTISSLNALGYTLGGANVNSAATPDYYLRYTTYSAAEGSANAKVYNETSPDHINAISNTSQYWYYWNGTINISEHSNYYGWYTTNISRVFGDGSSVAYCSASVYVSPIYTTYTYNLTTGTSIAVTPTYTDVLGNAITTYKWASGDQNLGYFEGGSGTSYSGTSLTVPSAGHYTLYAKDSQGYEYVLPVAVNNASGTLHLGVTQDSFTKSTAPVVNVLAWKIADIDPNSISQQSGAAVISNSTDATAPESNVTSIYYNLDGKQHQFWIHYGNQDYESGDYVIISFWYKTSDSSAAGIGGMGISSKIWQSLNLSTVDSATSAIKDGNWHFGYRIFKLNQDVLSANLNAFCYGITTAQQAIQFTGVHATRASNLNNLSTGVTVEKWAYGNQTASYFDAGNGTSFTGDSFNVTQNGVVSVFAKDASGNELVRTYTVSNYDPYAGDVTPPSGGYNLSTTNWTTGTVTINVTATDAQSGVKSITTPSGTVVSGNTCSYTATGNGTYNFILTDNAGNTCSYPVTVSNIDRSVSVSYSSNTSYTIDPNNLSSPLTAQDITLTNNNTHVGAQVTLQSLTSALSGTNSFTLGAQVEEAASGNTTWSEIDNKSVQLAGGSSAVLGVLSPGGTGHIKLVGQLGSLRWPSAAGDTGNMQLTFTAIS